jgi:hypothetical protein
MERKMFKIFVIDRANQYNSFEFGTQDAADAAYDEWEAGGHDVFVNYIAAVTFMDKYTRINKSVK